MWLTLVLDDNLQSHNLKLTRLKPRIGPAADSNKAVSQNGKISIVIQVLGVRDTKMKR